jgi:3-deoxy-D-arabino-heptulosonate 7-phosphate (DAHP) synthase
MCEIPIRAFEAERRFVLDLSTYLHAKFQNGLKLIGHVIPPVIVAERARW